MAGCIHALGTGKENNFITKLWLFENVAANYQMIFLIFCVLLLEIDTVGFASKNNLFFHLAIIPRIMSMVIYWYNLKQSLYTHLQ